MILDHDFAAPPEGRPDFDAWLGVEEEFINHMRPAVPRSLWGRAEKRHAARHGMICPFALRHAPTPRAISSVRAGVLRMFRPAMKRNNSHGSIRHTP
jgi:hypothetical protein